MGKEVKKEKRNSKEIVELSEKQHVRRRSTMYISSVSPSEEDMLVFEDKILKRKKLIYSIGFYKCFIEIIDNAIDEAKRLKGTMSKIEVRFNSKTNEVIVSDTGEGFYKGQEINKETGLNKIETAVSRLRAGSNFFNDDTEESLIGTNGVGSSVVNILSERFTIETVNDKGWFFREWIDFERTEYQPKERRKELGTTVTFIPLKEVFKHGQSWNKQIIHTFMMFKQWLIKNTEKEISNLKFECYFDDEKLDLNIDFLPKDRIEIKTKIGTIIIFETYDGSSSTSFINSAQCSGIHEKMINDIINEKIGNSLAHHHYECFTALNFPPKLVSFADQNKTKLATSRWDITEIMNKEVYRKIEKGFFNTDMFDRIVKKIEEINKAQTIKNIKAAKKNSKIKFSDKYIAPSQKNSVLLLCEGMSAQGSLLQARDSNSEGVYSLKGKVKNCNSLSDLSTNKEVIDIMNILDLDVDSKKKPTFDKIVIATDADCLHPMTKLITSNGTKLLKDVTYEDKVLTHTRSFKQIERITEKKTKEVVYLTIKTLSGKVTFNCTPDHKWPIYDSNVTKKAKDLRLDDYLIVNEIPCKIFSYTHSILDEEETFIDLTIRDDHTFMLTDDDNNEILTHNCDGGHISSLLINIFVRWFPHIVEQGHLYCLVTPIISVDQGSKRKYFYQYEDFEKWSVDNKYSNLRYLKGLGSLDADTGDWDYVLKTNRVYMQIYKDRSANRMLDIAFNSGSHARKAWLKE